MAPTIPLDAALQAVLDAPCGRAPVAAVPLDDALGRHLATDVATDGPWPATDRAAMDGFAVMVPAAEAGAGGGALPAGTRLRVVGESLAGHPFARPLAAGEAVRIMTGAVVPPGAAVVPVEQTSGFAGSEVELHAAVRPGQHVRPLGSEAQAGQRVLAAGTRLDAAAVGVLAVLGRASVPVFAPPRVAIVATGDEVVPVDRTPLPHQVRESNSWALAAQVRRCGGEPRRLGVAPDREDELQRLLERGLDEADVLVTIGGISKGTHDLVHAGLERLGVAPVFHGIELKPGKPTWFGWRERGAQRTFVFGLPGNPASSFTVFDLLVRPLLRRLQGADGRPERATARVRGTFKPNARLQAIPARLGVEDGALVADLAPPSPSGDPFGLLLGTAYALVPPGAAPGAGLQVPVVGYPEGLLLP